MIPRFENAFFAYLYQSVDFHVCALPQTWESSNCYKVVRGEFKGMPLCNFCKCSAGMLLQHYDKVIHMKQQKTNIGGYFSKARPQSCFAESVLIGILPGHKVRNCMPTLYLFWGLAGFYWSLDDFPDKDDRVSHAFPIPDASCKLLSFTGIVAGSERKKSCLWAHYFKYWEGRKIGQFLKAFFKREFQMAKGLQVHRLHA